MPFPADRRPQVRASLAGALRAVVAQILVPKSAGGRIAAREKSFSAVPPFARVILDGAISQLPIAIESGRSLGMRTMVDALGALVRDGIVDITGVRERTGSRSRSSRPSSATASMSRASRSEPDRGGNFRSPAPACLPPSRRHGAPRKNAAFAPTPPARDYQIIP